MLCKEVNLVIFKAKNGDEIKKNRNTYQHNCRQKSKFPRLDAALEHGQIKEDLGWVPHRRESTCN